MMKKILIVSSLSFAIVLGVHNILDSSKASASINLVPLIKSAATTKFIKEGHIPETIKLDKSEYKVTSTINKKLQVKIERLLRRYRSDYAAVVVLDNETGNILASTGYEGRNKKKNYHLSFSSTHPSASLFKIITSAKLLEENKIDVDTKFKYRGKGTTLYKYQLKDKKSRWTRSIPFKKAFAYSNNVIFGKAALQNLTGIELFDMAYKFGFNRNIFQDVDMPKSIFQMPEGHYNLAELASGFNKETSISPVHAAAFSAVVANGGKFIQPNIFSSIFDVSRSVELDQSSKSWSAFSSDTADELKELMEETISKGTARGSFRRLKRKLKKSLDIGGKTGSLTGGMPTGKRDWFSAYAMPKKVKDGKGISIAVMNINVKKWYVKSAFLAKEIISYYFTKVKPIQSSQDDLVARSKILN